MRYRLIYTAGEVDIPFGSTQPSGDECAYRHGDYDNQETSQYGSQQDEYLYQRRILHRSYVVFHTTAKPTTPQLQDRTHNHIYNRIG